MDTSQLGLTILVAIVLLVILVVIALIMRSQGRW